MGDVRVGRGAAPRPVIVLAGREELSGTQRGVEEALLAGGLVQVEPAVQDHAGVEDDRSPGRLRDDALHDPAVGPLDLDLPVAHLQGSLAEAVVAVLRGAREQRPDHVPGGLGKGRAPPFEQRESLRRPAATRDVVRDLEPADPGVDRAVGHDGVTAAGRARHPAARVRNGGAGEGDCATLRHGGGRVAAADGGSHAARALAQPWPAAWG
jgi:hypothetical protein